MPRIPLVVAPNPAPSGGETPAAPSLYAHAPSIQRGTRALDQGIGDAGRITPQLRKLMNVRVASIVGCPF